MGLNSTQLLSYHEISTENIDLIEDAFGFDNEFCDVIALLGVLKPAPEKSLTRSLIEKIRRQV